MENQKNLISFVVLTAVIMFGFHFLYEKPKQEALQAIAANKKLVEKAEAARMEDLHPGAASVAAVRPKDQVLAETDRIRIESPSVRGTLNLQGCRLDDLTLTKYHEQLDSKSPEISLLAPAATKTGYYVDMGWTTSDQGTTDLPSASTVWHADAKVLTPDHPVKLTWTNRHGVVFEREITLDQDYMFTIKQTITNRSGAPMTVEPFTVIKREHPPKVEDSMLLHEGPVAYMSKKLHEVSYAKLAKDPTRDFSSKGGWLGIADKYWLVALVPDQQADIKASIQGQGDQTSVNARNSAITIAAGQSASTTHHVFAGAKVLKILDGYEKKLGFENFDLAVDFGSLYFITQPTFYFLDWLHAFLGNFGLAILALTLLVKLAFFPLANKSYRSMAQMKALQPQIQYLQEMYQDDKLRMNEELLKLYREKKVNPAGGCLPMLIQMPVFFALYKVLFVSIEMRHAPFYGWVHDLSAPDPTSFLNLFGLLPFAAPNFLQVGIWPILMGLTMWLQQRLSPQPTDQSQAIMFAVMPIMMTFLLAQFAVGLVIYWTFSNLLSIAQQWAIMRLEERRAAPANRNKR